MNAKKKNKNKPKPQKVPPKTESETLENLDVKETLPEDKPDSCINVETVNKEPVIVPEITSDVMPATEIGTPKRPKRAKGKKKEDISDAEKLVEDKTEQVIDAKDLVQGDKSENVIPRSRKKKKGKKVSEEQSMPIDTISGETVEAGKKIDAPEDFPKKDSDDQPLEQEPKPSKKKKKKKTRNDSEKSDKNEDIPCTLAFKKLLESQDQDVLVQVDDEKEIQILSDENNSNQEFVTEKNKDSTSDLKDLSIMKGIEEKTDHCPTTSKKNKKNKKDKQSKSDVNKEAEQEIIQVEVTKETNLLKEEVIETEEGFSNTEKEKVKAKIIKPVEKKRKNKTEIQSSSAENLLQLEKDFSSEGTEKGLDVPSAVSSIICQNPENNTDTTFGTEIKEEAKASLHDKELSFTETKQLDFEHTDTEQMKTEIILEETLTQPAHFEEEQIFQSQYVTDDDFVETKTQKKKKKRHGKPEIPINISESIESCVPSTTLQKEHVTKSSATECKEKESCSSEKVEELAQQDTFNVSVEIEQLKSEEQIINVPDLIQYPMSSSQQLLDGNNNTIIQEISTPDEIKLQIPPYIGEPTVKGSGESPEIYSDKQPDLSAKVIEVDNKLNKSNPEKTDLKSKMIEVNQDMEELRLSIERSLAELTAIEKSEEMTEKQFDEKRILEQKDISNLTKTGPNIISATSVEPRSFEINRNISETIDIKESKQLMSALEVQEKKCDTASRKSEISKQTEVSVVPHEQPVCPSRKDNNNKSKSKKKGKQEITLHSTSDAPSSAQSTNESTRSTSKSAQESNKTEKTETGNSSQAKGKQQSLSLSEDSKIENMEDIHNSSLDDGRPQFLSLDGDSKIDASPVISDLNFERTKPDGEINAIEDNVSTVMSDLGFDPIEHFEDALTSSIDDVNQTFEMIVNDIKSEQLHHDNPQINIIAPAEDEAKDKKEKQNPVTKPKNLLGHPDIPVPSNKTDYKKEKNKSPNYRQATVKIKDSVDIEKSKKESKESQTKMYRKDFLKNPKTTESFSYMTNENNEFIYKYSFRKVFLQSTCHVCKKDLTTRVACKFCSLISYCSQKHMSEDWPRHQSLCFAVSTIAHLKDQKHIYADTKNITGHEYRILRMQMIVSCEKILKRKLEAWEQEALLYPRLCADPSCREWRQTKLQDCEGCGQISYCIEHPEHLPVSHQRWCKSYALYQKLVTHQQTKGRLEPQLPSKVLEHYCIPDKINDLLATIYEEKIDMSDVEYAALTQLASAPLTTAYCYQLFTAKMNATCANGVSKKSDFIIHSVGAELQYEADALNKWEIFFLHLRPDISHLRVVLVALDLNPSNLPLDLLGKFKLCEICRVKNRRLTFNFHDKVAYHDYCLSEDFVSPDIVCAFNQNIQRSSILNGNDPWPSTVNSILKQRVPFIITSYTLEELRRDLARIKECSKSEWNVVAEPMVNQFASVRPDRNFITDHEMPLQFKNYSCSILCGAF